jgi:hypothetical protein
MGDLLFIIIAGVVSAFCSKLFNKTQKRLNSEPHDYAEPEEEQPEVWTEEPLDVEEAEEVWNPTQPLREVQSPTPPVQERIEKTIEKPVERKQPSSEEPLSSPIRIRTKAEARRAFLEAEIFNRKYE